MKTCKRDEESTQMLRSFKIRLFEGKCKATEIQTSDAGPGVTPKRN